MKGIGCYSRKTRGLWHKTVNDWVINGVNSNAVALAAANASV